MDWVFVSMLTKWVSKKYRLFLDMESDLYLKIHSNIIIYTSFPALKKTINEILQ